ncbi:MAG: dihydroxy-acid dehydratase [Cumulibacter sp.]
MSDRQTHSDRYVTSGYQNALHRAYLYGLGLTDRDMKQPFVGVAQCVNEARPEARALQAAFDITRDACAAAGLTSRHFGVPVALHESDPADAVKAREFAADSCELVVRGHWYDALIGTAATPASMFGVAQTIIRLRIPGLVVVPRLRSASADVLAAVAVLERLQMAVQVSVEEAPDELNAACLRLRAEVDGSARTNSLADDLRGGLLGDLAVPEAIWSGLAALAHECGISSLAELGLPLPTGLDDASAVTAGIDYPGPIESPLNYDAL